MDMKDSKESLSASRATPAVDADAATLIYPGALYKAIPFGYTKERIVTRYGSRFTRAAAAIMGGFSIYVSAYNLVSFGNVLANPVLVAMLGLDQGSADHIAAKQGGMVCLNPLGMILGALAGGILSNKLGRTKAMGVGLCLSLLGAALQTGAQNISWLCISRVLNGFGVGITDAIVPSWIAELSPTSARGSAIALEMFFAGLGVCSAFWITYGFSYVSNLQLAWRFPVGFQLFFTIVLFGVVHYMPESPRWLISAGRCNEAHDLLVFLHGPDLADFELEQISRSCREQKANAASLTYRGMLFGKHNVRRRVILTFLIQFISTFVLAFGMILSFAGTVFGFAGYSAHKTGLILTCNSIPYGLTFLVGVYYVDKIGGRNILLLGAAGAGSMMMIIGGLSKATIAKGGESSSMGAALVFCVYLYSACHGSSFATISWVIPVEIFPQASRSRGGAISIAVFAFGNGLSTMIAPYLFNAMGENFFFLFGGLTLLSVPLMYCLVPMTRGRSLEDLDTLLAGPWLYWKAEATYKTLKGPDS